MTPPTSSEDPIAPSPLDPEPAPAPEEPASPDPESAWRAEADRWKDLALRSQAELDNFRKRMAREKTDAIRFGNAALLESLLPVIDNFRFGLEAARQDAGSSVVFQGMAMVMKQLSDFLSDQGVTEFGDPGDPFDPNLHEAVQSEHSDTVGEGLILATLRRGYRLHDRLLRAANVVVSRGPAPSEA
jgi:molecular chaperone GrpE